ncbi:hypothetical protein CBM2637_B10023 [Cupriavidus taiwanensis]|nr:hypothetical protein CBM2637_B10023 [Cupriavidus taiwanensis]
MSSEGLGKEAMGRFAGRRRDKGRAQAAQILTDFAGPGVTKRRRQHAPRRAKPAKRCIAHSARPGF